MSAALLFVGAFLAQGASTDVMVTGSADRVGIETVDVAYEQVSQGRNDEAVARIERNRDLESDDPAAMINKGTAYARMGRESDARDCFIRAIASKERFDLQLANGQWMDSRRAARMARDLLERRETLAFVSRKES